MANRNWANGGRIFSMHVGPILANVNITIGATGAVSSFIGTVTASVTRVSTGLYTITMQDPYNSVFYANGSLQSPVSGLSGIAAVEIGNAPSASIQTLTGGTFQVKCLNTAGALADPASGSLLSVFMFLNNSAVKA